MSNSKYILFSSCDKCKPQLWKILGKTKHTYRCKGCRKVNRNNLQLIGYKEKTND
jgi:hypothetical protein